MARCGHCGGRSPRVVRVAQTANPNPQAGLQAGARPVYEVVIGQSSPNGTGKRFSTYGAALDYARRRGGIVRII